MFCPKCASQNIDGASFCRVCGANISLVPQALTGQLPVAVDDSRTARRSRRRDSREPNLSHAMKNAFMGIAFLCVSIALGFSFEGRGWWYWMLIPAFSLLGSGVAEYIRLKEERKKTLPFAAPTQASIPAPRISALPPRNTGELVPPPPSVTEGTTRHLGGETATRRLESPNEIQK